jgi:hypothetical protein
MSDKYQICRHGNDALTCMQHGEASYPPDKVQDSNLSLANEVIKTQEENLAALQAKLDIAIQAFEAVESAIEALRRIR